MTVRAAAALSLLAMGCVVQLPSPATPEQIVPRPNVILGAPAPGEGDVVIDSLPEAADVVEAAGSGARTICSTPCEVHLSQGLHDLRFIDQTSGDWRGDGRITVGAVPSAYRYALGHQDVNLPGLITALLFGVTGASLLAPASIDFQPTLFAVALGLTVLGAAGLYMFRPHIQKGVGVQWTPAPPAADLR